MPVDNLHLLGSGRGARLCGSMVRAVYSHKLVATLLIKTREKMMNYELMTAIAPVKYGPAKAYR